MANRRSRQGKAAELQVIGLLTDAGIDCYLTVVDDQGIDAVARVRRASGPKYFDVQVKSGRTWNAIRGRVAALADENNTILILFNSTLREMLWLDAAAVRRRFPPNNKSTWGDIFLNQEVVDELRKQGRGDVARLVARLER